MHQLLVPGAAHVVWAAGTEGSNVGCDSNDGCDAPNCCMDDIGSGGVVTGSGTMGGSGAEVVTAALACISCLTRTPMSCSKDMDDTATPGVELGTP